MDQDTLTSLGMDELMAGANNPFGAHGVQAAPAAIPTMSRVQSIALFEFNVSRNSILE